VFHAEDPADVFVSWRAEHDAAVVSVGATATTPTDPDALDLLRLPCSTVLQEHGPDGEQVLIGDGRGQIRLDIRHGTALQGPVRLRYELAGLSGLEPKLLTLQRLAALMRLKRFPRRIGSPSAPPPRSVMALRALDARRAGASQREIAAALFGDRRVAADWNGRSGYLRTRVQRLIALGATLTSGGHQRLLSS